MHQRIAYGCIAVGVELHGVPHNVGHLVVASVVQPLHTMEYASLYGLESVVYMGHGTLQDYVRCIIQEPVLVHAGELVFDGIAFGICRLVVRMLFFVCRYIFFVQVFFIDKIVAHIYLNSLMFS